MPESTGKARLRLENAGSAPWRSRGQGRPAALLSLARPARQRDRLGRHHERRSPTSWSRARPSSSPCPWSRRGLRGAIASPSTSSRSSGSGSRSSDRRRSTCRSTWRRASPSAGLRVVVHGGSDPETRGGSRRAGRGDRRPRIQSPLRTSSPAHRPPATGRDCCSTHTRRATRLSEARSTPSPVPTASGSPPWAPGRRTQPALRPALLFPSLLEGLEPDDARRSPRLHRRGLAVRGTRRRQTSVAIRSSTRLKTKAPSTSATIAAIDRVDRVGAARQRLRRRAPTASPRSEASGSSPSGGRTPPRGTRRHRAAGRGCRGSASGRTREGGAPASRCSTSR